MDISQTNQLVLKSVIQLFEYNYFIPAYQRGYRWTETQVIQLLEDIWNFAKNPPQQEQGKEKPFYCLQPIVVKNYKENEWEVIDGQQRLTTIVLIIHYFNEMWIGKQKIKEPHILYETRNDCFEFITQLEIDTTHEVELDLKADKAIRNIKLLSNKTEDENIDFYHIAKAYKTIHYWVTKMGNNLNNNLLQSAFQFDTKVIWYEAEETKSNNSIDIFTRLNIGKIPLTNSELIKALFLQRGNFAEEKVTLRQEKIALEWDLIEKSLQDDAFWYFIYNPENPFQYDNRIEYIFDLMKEKKRDSEHYFTFNKFIEDFSINSKNNKPDIDKIWKQIKEYILTFEEWYKDYILFHYIGYLIDCIEKQKNKNKYVEDTIFRIKELKHNSSQKTKNEFKEYLKKEIKKQVNRNIDKIEYGDKYIKKILLLFNIQTVLETQKSDMRFPFHKYKSEDWDIEHVSSQTDKDIAANNRLDWINDILEYFTGTTDISNSEEFVKSLNENDLKEKATKEICISVIKMKKAEKIEDESFNTAFKLVQNFFKEVNQIEDKNDISNLALLDSTTNRSYGNSFFPIKRKRIIENDSKGVFVPIATKNLFLKYYSKKSDENMFWNSEDAKDYLNAIKITLKNFLPAEDSL
ncbi:MAG: DUF262 domain-containing protein [Flavobacteriaceae bacterium]